MEGVLLGMLMLFGGPASFAVAGVAWMKVIEADAEAKTRSIETGKDPKELARQDRILFTATGMVATPIFLTILALFIWFVTAP